MADASTMLVTIFYTGIVSFVPHGGGYAVLLQDASKPLENQGESHVATISFPDDVFERYTGGLIKLLSGDRVGFDLRGFDIAFERGSDAFAEDAKLKSEVLLVEHGCPTTGCGTFKSVKLGPTDPIDASLLARSWATTGDLRAWGVCPRARFVHRTDARIMSQVVVNHFNVPFQPEYKVFLLDGRGTVGTITLAPVEGHIVMMISNTLPEERFGGAGHTTSQDEHVKHYYSMSAMNVPYADRKGLRILSSCPRILTPHGSNCPPAFWSGVAP